MSGLGLARHFDDQRRAQAFADTWQRRLPTGDKLVALPMPNGKWIVAVGVERQLPSDRDVVAAALVATCWTRVDGGFCTDASDLLGPLNARAFTFTCPTDGTHTHRLSSEAIVRRDSGGDIVEWNMVCKQNPENGILRIFND